MLYSDLYMQVARIRGCTFASLDAVTIERKSITRTTNREQVLLFGGSRDSGYEAMVKRRLLACGKDPDNFKVGSLPWGTRVGDTPLIEHKGNYYLQTIMLSAPDCYYTYPDGTPAPPPPPRSTGGLPPEKSVIVQTYNIEHIHKLRINREELT